MNQNVYNKLLSFIFLVNCVVWLLQHFYSKVFLLSFSVSERHFAGEKANLIWVVEYKYYYPARSQISITYYQPRERFKKLTIEFFFNTTTLFIYLNNGD